MTMLKDLNKELTDLYLKYRDSLDVLEDEFNISHVLHDVCCKALVDKNPASCNCGEDVHYGNNVIGALSGNLRNCIADISEVISFDDLTLKS
jgi:hypothetical protein